MRLTWFVLLSALIIFALGGCQPEEAINTPAPAAAAIVRANQAASPSLLTLARNPGAFEGQDLVLAGAYRPMPLLVCAEETHQSPATWALRDSEIEVLVSGFDGALRDLASPGLPLEVEGRWQRWEGPVGCGRRAPAQVVWHLQLTNILSPNPLSASLPFTPEPLEPLVDGILTATPGLAGTPSPVASGTSGIILPTGSATVTATLTSGEAGTPTATRLGTSTPTPNALTSTATATTIPASPFPTPTIDSGKPLLLDYDDLEKRTIGIGGVQDWRFAAATDLPIVIRVAPSSGLDVSLQLLDPTDSPFGEYNQGGAGQAETIDEDRLPVAGLYRVRISAVNQSSGSYAVVLQSESSRPFVIFQGILSYGETRAGTTPINGDHLWNFEGVAGDLINIRVRATTPTDMQIYLNSHDGQETEYVNNNTVFFPPEDREEILQYRLPASGLYTIGIGEEDLESLGYTIVVERAS